MKNMGFEFVGLSKTSCVWRVACVLSFEIFRFNFFFSLLLKKCRCLHPNFDLACHYAPLGTCECKCLGNLKTLLYTGYFCVHTDVAHFCCSFLFHSHRGPQNCSICVSIPSQPNVLLLSFSPVELYLSRIILNYIEDNIGVMHHFRKAAGRRMLQGGTWGMPA